QDRQRRPELGVASAHPADRIQPGIAATETELELPAVRQREVVRHAARSEIQVGAGAGDGELERARAAGGVREARGRWGVTLQAQHVDVVEALVGGRDDLDSSPYAPAFAMP